jgi:hypothetical protein
MPLWASVLIGIVVTIGSALSYASFEQKNSKEKKK